MHILIVEDEEIVSEILIARMKRWGQNVVLATSNEEAVSKIKTSRFDLVLLDIMLPDGLGYEIIPEIKQALPNINIITMTGQNTPALERTIREFGITYFMAKPVDFDELKNIIDHIANKQKRKVA
jgi:DNA-binding response OmpR family regulator